MFEVLRESIRDARMYMSKMRAHIAKDEQCPKGMGRALDWTCMLKVAASVAAELMETGSALCREKRPGCKYSRDMNTLFHLSAR